MVPLSSPAGVAESVDAMDSKSIFRKKVGVRVPPSVPALRWSAQILRGQARAFVFGGRVRLVPTSPNERESRFETTRLPDSPHEQAPIP